MHTRYGINPHPSRVTGGNKLPLLSPSSGGLLWWCSRSALYGDSATTAVPLLPPPPPPPGAAPAIALVRAGCLRRQFGQRRLSFIQTLSQQPAADTHGELSTERVGRLVTISLLSKGITPWVSPILPSLWWTQKQLSQIWPNRYLELYTLI